jgi:polygalacturonase
MFMKNYLPIGLFLLLFGCKKGENIAVIIPAAPLSSGINVRDYGAVGNGMQDDTQAFEKAMQVADSLKQPVIVPVGKYRAYVKILYNGLTITGQQQPTAAFQEGTIIVGSINCNNKKNVLIQQLGIDAAGVLRPQDAAALISGDGIDSVSLFQTFRNISLRGGGYHEYEHGILCQTGRNIQIKNIIVRDFYHGIAIRSGEVTIDSVEAISCGFTSIIIKSAETFNARTTNVEVNHINISGNAGNPFERGGTILVQSYDNNSLTENIHIQNVTSTSAGVSAIAINQTRGIIRKVRIENCNAVNQGDDPGRACYEVQGGSDILFKNCTSEQARGTGFRCAGNTTRVRVEQCFEKNSGILPWQGNFNYLQLNGIEIIK